MTNASIRDELVARLVRAGELEISGESQEEVDSYFDTENFAFHGPDGFDSDYAGLTEYFQSIRAAFEDRTIRRGIIVAEGDLDTARAVAERVLTEIRNSPYADEAHGVPPQTLTVSAGVTTYRPEEDNAFSFFKRADENLLTAKRTGKDRVVAD